MTIKIGINGMGRIGRLVFRAMFEEKYPQIELVAINGPAAMDTHLHLIKYDSVHGTFKEDLKKIDEENLSVNGKNVKLFRSRDPKQIPWGELGVDVVLECSGIFTKRGDAALHIEAGAKKVLISAPSKSDDVKTIVFGVNDEQLNKDDDIVSIGSCTTNCLAPVAKVLDEKLGIERGFMTTIHAYTNDQNVLDKNHKDLRRARACGLSMVPTSTGAAKALGLVLPQLKGKLDGGAIRVPTANVSMVDLNFVAKKDTSVDEVNKIIADAIASGGNIAKSLAISYEPLVSIDFNHSSCSSYFDASLTKVNGNLVKVAAWYDNEWSFSLRMLDIVDLINNL